jgi:hypothetical protein
MYKKNDTRFLFGDLQFNDLPTYVCTMQVCIYVRSYKSFRPRFPPITDVINARMTRWVCEKNHPKIKPKHFFVKIMYLRNFLRGRKSPKNLG